VIDIKRIYILTSLFVLLGFFTQAQDTLEIKNLKAGQAKRLGNAAIKQGDYHAAEDYFTQFTKLKPNNAGGAYKLAEAYRINRDYVNAQEWYDKACKLSGESNSMALFYYGLMLKMNGNCDKAKEQFAKFKKKAGASKQASDLKKQMKAEITGCDSAISFTKQASKVSVTHLDSTINRIHVEHSPLMLDTNTLLYSSIRTDKKVYTVQSAEDTTVGAYKKFYTAKKENGKWAFSGEYTGNDLNKEGFNNTNAAFSVDGKRLYFTRCKANWNNKMICAIYVSTKQDDGNWNEPTPLDKIINNPKFTSTQPTTSVESVKQNEVIYFTSDRPGGRGGLDIWYIIYDFKKKTYSQPKNAGSKINTTGDEITPYYEQDNRTLFFSSNGWPGLGGLDVFKTKGEMKQFSPPENIGAPINSTADDIYYVEGKNKDDGFFVSNRKGGVAPKKNPTCCDDIYAFKNLQYVKLNIEGIVTDEKGNPVNNAKISLYTTPAEGDPIFIKSVETNSLGKYDMNVEVNNNYKVVFEKERYLNNATNLSTKDITSSQILKQNAVVLKEVSDKAFVLTNVHYATDRHDLLPDAKKDIDTTLLAFLTANPDVIVEVSSHTDDQASDTYNNSLSQKRADGVVKYLIEKGIQPERIQAHGYGETKPIGDNKTEEGRAANRRTEFKIIGKLAPKEKEYNEKE
jgi:OOP family OmpA-OmpF porin